MHYLGVLSMGRSSRIPGFYKLSLEQRVDETEEFATLTDDEVSTLRGTLSLQLADRMIEDVEEMW